MNGPHKTSDILRKVAFLTLIGFSVVVLSGPILAILSVLLSMALIVLPFAFLGLLVVGMFRLAVHGKAGTWNQVRDLGNLAGNGMRQFGRMCGIALTFPPRLIQGVTRTAGQILAFPGRVVRFVGTSALHLMGGAWRFSWFTVKGVVEISLMALTGALIGGVVGVVFGAQNHDWGVSAIQANTLLGGTLGALVGAVTIVLEKLSARRQPARS